QNIMRTVKRAYDEALEQFDVLVMPTTPMKAQPLPPLDCSLEEYIIRSEEMLGNTAQFCSTGHPSLNVPCGVSEGLPVGMMMTGRLGGDATVLRAGHTFEQEVFAAPPVPEVDVSQFAREREHVGEWGR